LKPLEASESNPITVYTDLEYIFENLTDKRFKLVDKIEDAKIIWARSDFYELVDKEF
jgi:hypothetical protein